MFPCKHCGGEKKKRKKKKKRQKKKKIKKRGDSGVFKDTLMQEVMMCLTMNIL